jgi:hypothetical protein
MENAFNRRGDPKPSTNKGTKIVCLKKDQPPGTKIALGGGAGNGPARLF